MNTGYMRSLVLYSAIMLALVVSNATLFAGHPVHGHLHVPSHHPHLLSRYQLFRHPCPFTSSQRRSALLRGVDRSALRLTVHHSGAENTVSPNIRVFALQRRTTHRRSHFCSSFTTPAHHISTTSNQCPIIGIDNSCHK